MHSPPEQEKEESDGMKLNSVMDICAMEMQTKVSKNSGKIWIPIGTYQTETVLIL